jgi:hypothetical protein
MEAHHPKPVHSWRDLLREIGVIVISVLIAISAEQIVEWLHWRHKVREAVENMRQEMIADDLPQATVRAATQACLDQRLAEIGKAAEAGADRARLRALALLAKVRARYGACVITPSFKNFDLDADGLDPLAGMLSRSKL